ncbi:MULTISPECIES: hypothetical protein [unclassified Pseudoalteromonas]|uniref:hypothetical protein n=1 Tax=unclassified Pseudoalteromonas TaxID=194690 RepID=UPI0015F8066D|nr:MULTISPECIES: hypothetical protein [unclassified Pseudoalteromonas]MBB1290982.1 hypothetical protein [Pseudoalteromonas sp. SR41-5]MBB1307268.1 hypothetical protein [Pseudoalteromonas sp. SR43-5]MBB1415316.1 hypothetical protein [Pseudoalteromonas sp. SG43-8]|tara:strand:- start:460 stop:882 length:423 start_codon:yes stop_codon:yes gene_type:complete
MIIVLYANTGESLKKAFSYIEHQHAGLSDHVNLSRIGDIELRIAQLNQIPDRKTERRVTVVSNPQTGRELALLRGMGAVVCHQYGALSPLYTTEIKISPLHDLHYVPHLTFSGLPGHVFTVDELLSECKVKHRKFRQRAK